MSLKTREMDDKLSKLIGAYLLRGYALLDDYCAQCQNPLMRSRSNQLYCVYCNEVNPVSNEKTNTITNINQNDKFNSNTNSSEVTEMIEDIDDSNEQKKLVNKVLKTVHLILIQMIDFTDDIEVSKKVIQNKLRWATDLFANCNTANECTQYCQLIKTCSDTLQSLNKLNIQHKKSS